MSTFKKGRRFIKITLVGFLEVYQFLFSAEKGLFGLRQNKVCAFYPSCSEYSKQALLKFGVLKGLWVAFKRLLRCHPWQKNYYDPIA